MSSHAEPKRPSAFRPVPRTGVIYVTSEAQQRGFDPNDPDWCNLGQGQPETGELPGAPPRVTSIAIRPEDQDYSAVAGLWELREAVAGLYNARFRRGLPSQYSAENVAVGGGGRSSCRGGGGRHEVRRHDVRGLQAVQGEVIVVVLVVVVVVVVVLLVVVVIMLMMVVTTWLVGWHAGEVRQELPVRSLCEAEAAVPPISQITGFGTSVAKCL